MILYIYKLDKYFKFNHMYMLNFFLKNIIDKLLYLGHSTPLCLQQFFFIYI